MSAKKPKGILFVKSSGTLDPKIVGSTLHNNKQTGLSISNSSSFLPTPKQTLSNAGSGLGGEITQRSLPPFGSPAISSFSNPGGNNFEMSGKFGQSFVKSGNSYSSLKKDGQSSGVGYSMPGFTEMDKAINKKPFVHCIPKTTTAQPVCTTDEYLKAVKNEKDPFLMKIRKLAHEVVTLKSDRPNAKDKLHSAANRIPLRIDFNFEAAPGQSFQCFVFIDNVGLASGVGAKRKDAKSEAYEKALQKILMPHLRTVQTDPTKKELQASKEAFTSPPPEPSKVPLPTSIHELSKCKESNQESAGLKRRHNEYKKLDEFVIVEPKIPVKDCTAAHTLRRSADFNHMLLEYEYTFKGESARCVLKIENEVLADINGVSKAAAKNIASINALDRLKKFCWIIKTKQAVDSNSRISKDEIVSELNEQRDKINNDNIGNKMLRKMGWSGGGVGKDGDGIAEPVSLERVLNREGLGLSSSKGVTNEFRKRIKEVIENYAASDNQEDLVFSSEFRLEERQIIHEECRRLNLRSKGKGKANQRYLCVRRKRSVNELFDHLMSVGGETVRYQLVPPGCDVAVPAYADPALNPNATVSSRPVPVFQVGNNYMRCSSGQSSIGIDKVTPSNSFTNGGANRFVGYSNCGFTGSTIPRDNQQPASNSGPLLPISPSRNNTTGPIVPNSACNFGRMNDFNFGSGNSNIDGSAERRGGGRTDGHEFGVDNQFRQEGYNNRMREDISGNSNVMNQQQGNDFGRDDGFGMRNLLGTMTGRGRGFGGGGQGGGYCDEEVSNPSEAGMGWSGSVRGDCGSQYQSYQQQRFSAMNRNSGDDFNRRNYGYDGTLQNNGNNMAGSGWNSEMSGDWRRMGQGPSGGVDNESWRMGATDSSGYYQGNADSDWGQGGMNYNTAGPNQYKR